MHVHESVFGISAEADAEADEIARIAEGHEDWLPVDHVIWLTIAMVLVAVIVALV